MYLYYHWMLFSLYYYFMKMLLKSAWSRKDYTQCMSLILINRITIKMKINVYFFVARALLMLFDFYFVKSFCLLCVVYGCVFSINTRAQRCTIKRNTRTNIEENYILLYCESTKFWYSLNAYRERGTLKQPMHSL